MTISVDVAAKFLEVISEASLEQGSLSCKHRSYLRFDEQYAKTLYCIHKLGYAARVEVIKNVLGIDDGTVSKYTAGLYKAGYVRRHYVIEPNKRKLHALELEVASCVSFRDTAAMLLFLLSCVQDDLERKISIDLFLRLLNEQGVLLYLKKEDLFGDVTRKGLFDLLEEAEYIQRTVTLIRPRDRIMLERLFLYLVKEMVALESLKSYRFPADLVVDDDLGFNRLFDVRGRAKSSSE